MLLAAGATMADVDRNGATAADRIQSQALRQALATFIGPTGNHSIS
jgi:hypothetical protein